MGDLQLYEELARHLDQGIIGSPKSPALIEILKILFPVEEAEIAVKMPMQNKILPELKELFPEKADTLEEILPYGGPRNRVYHAQTRTGAQIPLISFCCGLG